MPFMCMPFMACNRQVDSIDRRQCNLQTVPHEVERYARHLEELLLDMNHIKELPKVLFRLTKLKTLGLSDNDIYTLPADIAQLHSLMDLNLSRNDISDLPEEINACRQLMILDLSSNPITRLPAPITELTSLTHLGLNDITLTQLPTDIGQLCNLRSLEVRENLIKSIPPSVVQLRYLQRFDLGQNELTSLPPEIGGLVSLQELYIDSNELTGLPEELLCCKNLEQLDVSENKLVSLPDSFGELNKLTDLSLSQNSLQFLPNSFGKLKKLVTLKVDRNSLTLLTPAIGSCTELVELFLTENLLSELPSSIGHLTKLKTLNIDKNQLKSLPSTIGACNSLTVFSMRENLLEDLPLEIGRLENLIVLDVSNNRLSFLPYTVNVLCKLQALWLSENQSQALMKLQTDIDPKTNMKVLTCYLLPQQSAPQSDANKLVGSKSFLGGPKVHFGDDELPDEDHVGDIGKFERHNTPHPKPHNGNTKVKKTTNDNNHSQNEEIKINNFSNNGIGSKVQDSNSLPRSALKHSSTSSCNEAQSSTSLLSASQSDLTIQQQQQNNNLMETKRIRVKRDDNKSIGLTIAGGIECTPYKENDSGIFISKLAHDGPAMTAGLKVGDKILRVNDIDVQNIRHEQFIECMKCAGDVFILTIQRDNNTNFMPTPISSPLPEPPYSLNSSFIDNDNKKRELMNFIVKRDYSGSPGFSIVGGQGKTKEEIIIVSSVTLGGPADKVGLKTGDIILSINGTSVKGIRHDQAVTLLTGSPGQEVKIKILRDTCVIPPIVTPVTSPIPPVMCNSISSISNISTIPLKTIIFGEPSWDGKIESIELQRDLNKSLGLSIVGGSDQCSHPFGIEKRGVFISKITPNSPAAYCGRLRIGDRILSVNDKDIRNSKHKEAVDILKSSGPILKIGVLHEPQPSGLKEVSIRRRVQNESLGLVICGGTRSPQANPNDKTDEGIFVERVDPNSCAAECPSIHNGVRILEVNDDSILGCTQDEAASLLRNSGIHVRLLICDGFNKSSEREELDVELFTFEKFLRLYHKICPRTEVQELFVKLSGQKEYLTRDKLIGFLNEEQRDPRLNEILFPHFTINTAQALIAKFEIDENYINNGKMSGDAFLRFLMSDENSPIFLDRTEMYQDMDQPLSHYYINSSHNTYLVGRQYGGKSSTEIYRTVLLSGCRCVELDCWDGTGENKGEPIITHGKAMCTDVFFKDVLYQIRDTAFARSDFPVILSFENHCSKSNQQKMAKYCMEIFGDMLLSKPLSDFPLEPGVPLPPPSRLKRKILIKNKRLKPEVEKVQMEQFLREGKLDEDDEITENPDVVGEDASLPRTNTTTTYPTTMTSCGSSLSVTSDNASILSLISSSSATAGGSIVSQLSFRRHHHYHNYPSRGKETFERNSSFRIPSSTYNTSSGSMLSNRNITNMRLSFRNKSPNKSGSGTNTGSMDGFYSSRLAGSQHISSISENASRRQSTSNFSMFHVSDNSLASHGEYNSSKDYFTSIFSKIPGIDGKEQDEAHPELKQVNFISKLKPLGFKKAQTILTKEEEERIIAEYHYTGATTNIHPLLSSLVNYTHPVKFSGFDVAEQNNLHFHMSSYSESTGLTYLKQNAPEFVNYNKRQLSRIYPKGARVDSSNFLPQIFWNAGCHMVSLNFQTPDVPMQLNQGKFEYNGNCGYLLKPDFMRRPDKTFDPFSESPVDGIIAATCSVRIISGQFICDRKIGTYVEVEMYGLPTDTIRKEHKTKTIPTNGLNPIYNEDPFVFRKVILPDLAVLRFAAYDENGKQLGQRILPLDGLQAGYRHISLRTETNMPTVLPTLFVHIVIKTYVPDEHSGLVDILADPRAFYKPSKQEVLRKLVDDDMENEQIGNGQGNVKLENGPLSDRSLGHSLPHDKTAPSTPLSGMSKNFNNGNNGSSIDNGKTSQPNSSRSAAETSDNKFKIKTIDIEEIKKDKVFIKLMKKQQKDVEELKKKHGKQRDYIQKQQQTNVDKLIYGGNRMSKKKRESEKRSNPFTSRDSLSSKPTEGGLSPEEINSVKMKSLVSNQTDEWSSLLHKQAIEEYDQKKSHIKQEFETLKLLLIDAQKQQMTLLKSNLDNEHKELKQQQTKKSMDDTKAIQQDKNTKNKAERDRRIKELNEKNVKVFVEERKRLAMKAQKHEEQLQMRHQNQIEVLEKELSKALENEKMSHQETLLSLRPQSIV